MPSSRRDYDFGKQLGRGSFGVVHKVERKADKLTFVCKEISLRGMKSKAREDANQEVTLLRKVASGSEFIVAYVESFLEKESLHIIMEYCEHGDLGMHLKRHKQGLEEQTVWRFLLQIGLGLQHLHANRILHRDIKALNVFLTAADDARLGDLGVARVLSEGTNFANTLIGTPYYLSPELCDQKPYNDRSDVWAYGCVIYEMCTLQHPFDAKNQVALLAKIVRGKYTPVPEVYSSELRNLIIGCLLQDYNHRPSCSELLGSIAARDWAERVGVSLGPAPDPSEEPKRAEARRKWRRLKAQITQLHDDAVKDLDAPTRLIWDSLYRLLRAKMAAELTEEDTSDIERHVFEELPPEHTDLISKVCKILPLEQESERCEEIMQG